MVYRYRCGSGIKSPGAGQRIKGVHQVKAFVVFISGAFAASIGFYAAFLVGEWCEGNK